MDLVGILGPQLQATSNHTYDIAGHSICHVFSPLKSCLSKPAMPPIATWQLHRGDRFRPEMPCQWLWSPLVTLEQWPSVTFTPSNCHGKMAKMAKMDKHGWLSQKMAGNDLWQLGRFFRDGHTHDPTKFMEPEYICSPFWLSHPWPIAAPFNLSRCGGLREADSSVGEADDFTQDREDGKGNAHIQGNSNHTRPGARVEKHGSWDMARSRTAGAGHRLYLYHLIPNIGRKWGVSLTEQGSGPNQSTGCAHINLEIMGSQVFLSAIHGHTVWIEILSTRDISANGSWCCGPTNATRQKNCQPLTCNKGMRVGNAGRPKNWRVQVNSIKSSYKTSEQLDNHFLSSHATKTFNTPLTNITISPSREFRNPIIPTEAGPRRPYPSFFKICIAQSAVLL